MDATKQTSAALLDRANAPIAQLLRRFENLIALAPISTPSLTPTAVETYQMEVETAALVRAAEDILALTRALKEAWLFGRLDTLRGGEGTGAEESARGVVVGLRALAGEGTGEGVGTGVKMEVGV